MKRLKALNWLGGSAFAAVLVMWEFGARANAALELYFPPISQILRAIWELLGSPAIYMHAGTTLRRFLIGYLLAALLAVFLGALLGYFRLLHSYLETVIEFLRPMPSVAIIPVAILALGIGDGMIVAVTVYASVWPILINTIDGVRRIDATLIDTARTFGLGGRVILWRVILPAASPYIITGMRIGLSISLILVTTAEMIAGSKGLGYFILDEERSMNSRNMYAGVILVSLLGYCLNRLFIALEGRALRWRHGVNVREAL